MANRIMPVSHYPIPGAFLMGDALNMRHPLTGGGMTVALSDVVLLRDLLRPLNHLSDAAALCKYLQSFSILRKPMATTINTVAGALHTVFSASEDPLRKEMRQACFNYFCLGGVFSNGLMSLLSGMNPDPLRLVFHCLALAVYTVGRLLLPLPTPKRIWIGTKLILVALGIFLPIIKAEGIRATFFPVTMLAYYRTPPTKLEEGPYPPCLAKKIRTRISLIARKQPKSCEICILQMPAELFDAFICAIDKGNIRTMPDRIMPVSHYPIPGAFLIRDALNMRHPLTGGGGMTVALSDVVLLRDLLRPLNHLSDAAALCKYLESFSILPKVALGIFLPIIKAEGIRATFFPVTMLAYYGTPPVS
ncbi:unnamed protein product [Dovyalis caffra]|uniref:Squalene monooxygenase n=1 Tax=Dovyalis caffra TaxID=77055 RepID=A0AAV1RCN0_9ROSI|nr:unnamed protein product [Dovyalis caffra]